MRTEEITIFKFEELSDSAKEKAREWWREGEDFTWLLDEYIDSLKEFSSRLGLGLRDWSIDAEAYRSYIKWSLPWSQDVLELSGVRLQTWVINNILPAFAKGKYYSTKGYYDENNKYHYKFRHSKITIEYDNCPLTGVVTDMPLIDPFLEFIASSCPGMINLEDILTECKERLFQAVQREIEWRMEDEQVDESIIANEYEFTEEGEIY